MPRDTHKVSASQPQSVAIRPASETAELLRFPPPQMQQQQRTFFGAGTRAPIGANRQPAPWRQWWLVPLAVGWTLAAIIRVPPIGAAAAAAYHYGADGGADGSRCSTKLDATLQQMFRKISAGSGGRAAHFPPIELDDDDDDDDGGMGGGGAKDSPFSMRPHQRPPYARNRADDAEEEEAAAPGDAADNLASGAALQQHLIRLQLGRRHHRHRQPAAAASSIHGGYDPYDLHATATSVSGAHRFEGYRRRPAAAASSAADDEGAAAAAAADDERRSRPWPNARTHRIQVAELRVRVPPEQHSYRPAAAAADGATGGGGGNWVHVDRCQFQPANRTLDTRLTFPDLTISGRVQLQPRLRAATARAGGSGYAGDTTGDGGGGGSGGSAAGCTMILRLRQAGIEFRTVPLRQPESAAATQRSRRTAPSVRTDSYFAQPGFVSVFAHGCDALLADGAGGAGAGSGSGSSGSGASGYGTTGGDWPLRRRRPARQRRPQQQQLNVNGRLERAGNNVENDDDDDVADLDADAFLDEGYMNYGRGDDFMRFSGDILGYASGVDGGGTGVSELRTWPSYFGRPQHQHQPQSQPQHNWQNVELANSAERDEQRTRDLEGMFARGVRGLLTSYMQRALQPAIKETLMESLGYRLSYG